MITDDERTFTDAIINAIGDISVMEAQEAIHRWRVEHPYESNAYRRGWGDGRLWDARRNGMRTAEHGDLFHAPIGAVETLAPIDRVYYQQIINALVFISTNRSELGDLAGVHAARALCRPGPRKSVKACPKGHTEGDCSSTCFSEEPSGDQT